MQNAPNNHLIKKERVGNEPWYAYGFKICYASNRVTVNYKRYWESKEQESHYIDKEGNDVDVNLIIADFNGKKDFAQSTNVPDSDWFALFRLFSKETCKGIKPTSYLDYDLS